MAKKQIQKEKMPVFTTVRVTTDTNQKLAKAVEKYNDRHADRNLTKDEFLSLLLDYCQQFGIDFDDTEKPVTAINKLRSSVKSFNDSAWAAKTEAEKFVREHKKRTDRIIAAEQEVCDTLAELVGDRNFNNSVLKPIRDDLENLYSLTAMCTSTENGTDKWTLSESLIEILSRLVNVYVQLATHSKDRQKSPTLLDRIENIENMLLSMKAKKRLYGWEDK